MHTLTLRPPTPPQAQGDHERARQAIALLPSLPDREVLLSKFGYYDGLAKLKMGGYGFSVCVGCVGWGGGAVCRTELAEPLSPLNPKLTPLCVRRTETGEPVAAAKIYLDHGRQAEAAEAVLAAIGAPAVTGEWAVAAAVAAKPMPPDGWSVLHSCLMRQSGPAELRALRERVEAWQQQLRMLRMQRGEEEGGLGGVSRSACLHLGHARLLEARLRLAEAPREGKGEEGRVALVKEVLKQVCVFKGWGWRRVRACECANACGFSACCINDYIM